jgi:hypothetical protein
MQDRLYQPYSVHGSVAPTAVQAHTRPDFLEIYSEGVLGRANLSEFQVDGVLNQQFVWKGRADLQEQIS